MNSDLGPHPLIYEVPAWTWLQGWSERLKRPLDLGTLPDEAFESFAPFDAVWLMGVWERSPAGRELAAKHLGLLDEYRRALPDFTERDVAGSPFAVHAYRVDPFLGGDDALRRFRERLASRGKRLILDFVPNHYACDHPWTRERPGVFLQGNSEDLRGQPEAFFTSGGIVFAHGRDPFFPPWTDTVQTHAFSRQARQAAGEVLRDLAGRCDGVRCDMAMLLLDRIFQSTWGGRAGAPLEKEYWTEAIAAARELNPGFIFIAEAYWDTEWELQQLGFDFVYDKRLYERLVRGEPGPIRSHLTADPGFQQKLLRYIENHDEPRARALLGRDRVLAAAALLLAVPGARLFFHGQLQGCEVRLPVQLSRGPAEAADPTVQEQYERLLRFSPRPRVASDLWQKAVFSPSDFHTTDTVIATSWQVQGERWLTVINYAEASSQGFVRVPGWIFGAGEWEFRDQWGQRSYFYPGHDLDARGLYVDLPGWGLHIFQVKRAG